MSKKRIIVDPFKKAIVEAEVQRTAPAADLIAFQEKQTDNMLNKARTILARELQRLESLSEQTGLDKDDSQILISYCKELREWKKAEKEELESLTEEELEKIANEVNS